MSDEEFREPSSRVEIIEYQSATRLRFELVKRGGGVIRAVEAPWRALQDPGARDRLLASLFTGTADDSSGEET